MKIYELRLKGKSVESNNLEEAIELLTKEVEINDSDKITYIKTYFTPDGVDVVNTNEKSLTLDELKKLK